MCDPTRYSPAWTVKKVNRGFIFLMGSVVSEIQFWPLCLPSNSPQCLADAAAATLGHRLRSLSLDRRYVCLIRIVLKDTREPKYDCRPMNQTTDQSVALAHS